MTSNLLTKTSTDANLYALDTQIILIPVQPKSNVKFDNFGYSLHALYKYYNKHLPVQSQQ